MKVVNVDELRAAMHHAAFEEDSDLQKWDGGCWIRYKMFENVMDSMPAVDAVEVVRCKDCCYYNGNMSYCDIDHYAVSDGYCHSGVRHADA